MKEANFTIEEAISLYKEMKSLHKVANHLHTSHIRLSNLFKEHNIEIMSVGKRREIDNNDINNILKLYSENKTIEEISKLLHITVKKVSKILKENGIKTNRWTNHIKKEKAKKNKNKNIKKGLPFKECPYCDWKTYDIENKSHSYAKHIFTAHNKTVDEHLSVYSNDKFYFNKIINRRKNKIQCKICGKYLSLIDDRHLKKHNINKSKYIELYGGDLTSAACKEKLQHCIEQMYNNPNWERYTSKYEKTIQEFLKDNNVLHKTHCRDIIPPYELDIFIPSKNIAIEFNGNKYHTEWFGGKTRQYHLSKTKNCKNNGIKLIHIFEDEFFYHKEIVFNKLAHLLGMQNSLPKIYGRKCVIHTINKNDAEIFLNTYHIQGYDPSTVHYGAFYNNELIAVMSFLKNKKNGNEWELTRFASNYNFVCCGVGGKLFKTFVKDNKPNIIKSFADRRWTINEDNNLYINLGFKFDSYTNPDYRYYNTNVDRYKRWHKFGFRKQILLKKYPEMLNKDMTETEMVKKLGYDRIWDCGLIKYVWMK